MSTLSRRLYKLLHQPPETPFERAKRAPRRFIFDYTFAMGVYFTAIGALIATLTDYYGFSVSVSTAIATMPSLFTALEFLSNRFFKHLRKFAIVWRLLLPTIVGSVIFPMEIGRVVMVIAFVLMCTAFHIYVPSYNAWTVNVTQGHIRSNYFSVRDLFFLPSFTLLSFGFAAIISKAEHAGQLRDGFLLLAAIELLFILPSLFLLLRTLPAPTAPIITRTGAAAPTAESKKASIIAEFKQVLSDKSYRKVLIFHLVWVFFFQFAGFLAVFQIQVLNQEYFTVTLYNTIASVFRIALLPVFSWVGTRYGWKRVIYICLAMMSLGTSCWVFITAENLWLLFPAGIILTTTPWAGLGIGMFHFQIACTKLETRSIYFSAHAGLSGLMAAIGVLCCNALVAVISEMEHPAYFIIFALWLFGCVATCILVANTPFPHAEPSEEEDEAAQQEAELAAERAAAAKEAALAAASDAE
ncbi:MAG: MFS transporter [Faecalibacterium sp.]